MFRLVQAASCMTPSNQSMEEKTVLVVALTPLMTTLQTMCGMSKLFLPYLTVSSNARPFFGCKGISFGESGCQLWTRDKGIQASVALSGSKCLRYMPFTPVRLRSDQSCVGTGNFHAYTLQEVSSLELCQVRCIETAGCTAIDFGALGCKVWDGDIQIESKKGSICLRYGADWSSASAFKPVDGGMARACRGENETDNLDSYFTLFWAWPENSSIGACQDRCARALLF